jgi:O-methyltransferase involved in polyketide biosynthesis
LPGRNDFGEQYRGLVSVPPVNEIRGIYRKSKDRASMRGIIFSTRVGWKYSEQLARITYSDEQIDKSDDHHSGVSVAVGAGIDTVFISG